MSHWNYRLIRHPEGWIAVHEVYYNEDGSIEFYSAEAATIGGDDED